MHFSKNKITLLVFIYTIVILSIFIISAYEVAFRGNEGQLSPLIPIKNWGIENLLVWLVLYPLIAIIGGFFGVYVITPLLLLIFKKFIGIKMSYGIQESNTSPRGSKIFKGFFPALLAINFAVYLANIEVVSRTVIYPNAWDYGFNLSYTFIPTLTILLALTLGIAIALFSPVWCLLDAGIVYSNKEKVKKKPGESVEGRTVGGWFINLLKGYAGIGAVFAFYELILLYLTGWVNMPQFFLVLGLLFVPLPIYLSLLTIPSTMVLDITRKARIKYIRSIARTLGIKDYIQITFEKVEKTA